MKTKKRTKVIIDTNLWISFLLTKDVAKIDHLLSSKSIVLLFSKELIDEFLEVAERPKFKKYFSFSDVESLLTNINTLAKFIVVTSDVEICRDSKDNFLLSLAVDGKADYLITGDKDLLVLEKVGKCKIISITDFFST